MRTTLALAVVALCFATTAHAGDSRAWTAGKKVLPANLQLIAGVNFDSIRGSQIFQTMMTKAMQNAGPGKDKIDKVKQACGVTLTDQLDSAVIGMTGSDVGVVVVALKSTTRKEVEACIQKVAKLDKKTVTITQDGQLTKYTGITDKKDLYLRWLSKDTFAFSASGDDKDQLAKLTDGGVADDKALKPPLAAINPASSIWFAVNKEQDLDQLHAKMQSAYGTADVKSGTITANVHVVVKDAKSATDAAAQATAQIDMLKKSGKVPAEFGPLLNGVKLKGAGSEIVIDAAIPEKDLLTLLATFMH